MSPAETAAALRSAEASRDSLANQFDPGAGWFAVLAASIAAHIAMTSIGVVQNDPLVFITGQVVLAVMVVVLVRLARRGSGVRVRAFTSTVVLGLGFVASATYAAGLAGAMWAAFGSSWVLAVASAVIGGIGYALAGRRWLRSYHRRPQDMAPSRSTLLGLAALTAAGVALVVLIANR